MVDKHNKRILCLTINNGRKHDFRIFKESGIVLQRTTTAIADSGYQGFQKIHEKTILPIKGSKKKPLTNESKKHNHEVGSQRVMVEHVIRELKIFKIISDKYRNRRKRFALRMNLIAAIYNYELFYL